MAPLEQGADLQEFAQNTGAHLFPKDGDAPWDPLSEAVPLEACVQYGFSF